MLPYQTTLSCGLSFLPLPPRPSLQTSPSPPAITGLLLLSPPFSRLSPPVCFVPSCNQCASTAQREVVGIILLFRAECWLRPQTASQQVECRAQVGSTIQPASRCMQVGRAQGGRHSTIRRGPRPGSSQPRANIKGRGLPISSPDPGPAVIHIPTAIMQKPIARDMQLIAGLWLWTRFADLGFYRVSPKMYTHLADSSIAVSFLFFLIFIYLF